VRPHGRRHQGLHGKGKLSVKGVQMKTEGQLKDHTVFPPGNTVSSEPASRPALLSSSSGGKQCQAYQGRLQTGMEIVTAQNKQARRLSDARMT